MEVAGIVVPGHGVASGRSPTSPYPKSTIAMQMPYFKMGGLDLDGHFTGTLNISINPRQFKIVKPSHLFPHLHWTDLHPPETFSFAHCQLKFQGVSYPGWIYYPHPETKEVHFQNDSTLEVITTPIPDINYGSVVILSAYSQEVSIP